jgi:hypothetical protein
VKSTRQFNFSKSKILNLRLATLWILALLCGLAALASQDLDSLPRRNTQTSLAKPYNPTNKARDGSYRAIKVTVGEGSSGEKRIALARSGRLAPKGEPTSPKPPQKAPAKSSQPTSKTR